MIKLGNRRILHKTGKHSEELDIALENHYLGEFTVRRWPLNACYFDEVLSRSHFLAQIVDNVG